MPIYEYRCRQGHVTDAIWRMGQAPAVVVCPGCFGPARRRFSPPAAIHFKGPGFYATDVKGRIDRKRRRNPGDDLPKEFDAAAAKIADVI